MTKAPYRFTILAVAAAIALATLAVWSIRLVVDVGDLRSELEGQVHCLRQIAKAQRALDDQTVHSEWEPHAARLHTIALDFDDAEIDFELPPPGPPRDALRRDLDEMVAGIRTHTARTSAELGEHWDSINLLVAVSLFFATSTLGLVVYVRLTGRPRQPRPAAPTRRLPSSPLSDRLAAVGTLATGVAHEINNPLTYVTTNLQLLREDLEAADRADHMAPLIDDALQGAERVGKIVQGLDRLRTIPVKPASSADLDAVLDAALEDQPGLVGITVHRSSDALPPVAGDASILIEVFRNIIDNAVFAIIDGDDRPHRLTVDAEAMGEDRIRVSISDTGRGIEPGIEDRIFEPFFTTREVGEGTGLGLYVCYAVIESLGGSIDVESDAGGTTVTVILPTG